jgi:hypothetical protein
LFEWVLEQRQILEMSEWKKEAEEELLLEE